MITLLIPILAICNFTTSDTNLLESVRTTAATSIDHELGITPTLTGTYKAVAYIYAVDNNHVYASTDSRLNAKKPMLLIKIKESNCSPLLKKRGN